MSKTQTPNAHHSAGEVISQGEKFIEKYSKHILYGLCGVIVIGVGIWMYFEQVHKPRLERAAASLYLAEEQFMAGADSAALQGIGADAQGLLAVADQYGSTQSGKLANAYAGIIYYDAGKYEEAIESLKKFSSKEHMVAPSITRLIGDCYVELGNYSEAAKYFEQAAKDASNPVITPTCLLKLGRVYEELGKYDKALVSYEKIKKEYYMAPEANTIDASILRVKAQIH